MEGLRGLGSSDDELQRAWGDTVDRRCAELVAGLLLIGAIGMLASSRGHRFRLRIAVMPRRGRRSFLRVSTATMPTIRRAGCRPAGSQPTVHSLHGPVI